MTTAEKLARVAETDSTFRRDGPNWVGKCLICNGPIAFDARTGEGATLEHIRARGRGGTEEPDNLGAVHARCNHEKGRRWDPKRRRAAEEYDDFVARLLERRRQRWRDSAPRPDAAAARGRDSAPRGG
jgi:5-methylcytosine-specific restriction endonuclease McrA